MKFTYSSQPLYSQEVDMIILPVFSKEHELLELQELTILDKKLLGAILSTAKIEKFTGKKGTTLSIQTHGSFPSRLLFLVGLGEKEAIATEDILSFAATGARKAQKIHASTVAFSLSQEVLDILPGARKIIDVVTGFLLGEYSFTKYKKPEEERVDIESVTLVTSTDESSVLNEIARGEVVAQAVEMARNLINEPPSITTPTYLAQTAEKIAKEHKEIKSSILSRSEMEKIGMRALLSIAQGSDEDPKFIHLTYIGGTKKTITLVGKGITFDTGGLSLKPAQSMETMKLDMSGAALVLAIFSVLPILHPEITVHGLISATENMPGASAIKPGDIVTAMNGKNIEILNTDAEGRVVLADAMSYADANITSDAIIDIATLTGACMIALGEDIAGLFSNNPNLTEQLKNSAKETGERIWEMPLVEEYKDLLKSHVADIKNIGGKYGGAITGALFIGAFVPKDTPWAHLDIAGPSFAEKDTPLCPHGGTGFGVRMLLDYLLSQ